MNGNNTTTLMKISSEQALMPIKIPPPPERYAHSRLVDFRRDPRDWGVPFLAAFGMNYTVIASQNGLTIGQVAYRMHKLNRGRPKDQRICAANYRNGSSPVSKMVIEAVGRKVKALLAPAIGHALAADSNVVNT